MIAEPFAQTISTRRSLPSPAAAAFPRSRRARLIPSLGLALREL